MHLKDLKQKTPAELVTMAEELGVEGASTMRKQDLMFSILKVRAESGAEIMGTGTIEVLNDGFGNAESLDSIEGVGLGTLFADTFLGSSGANFIYGGTGDVVDAREGDDDILLAGATFSLDGGDGVDSLEFSAFRLGLSPKDEMDDHKAYYDVKDFWPLLVRAGFLPSRIHCFSHKFGLNTFAVCRPSADPSASRS